MDKATLEAELKALAERCEADQPAVAVILFGLLGALALGLEADLSHHNADWSRATLGQMAAVRNMARTLRN